MDYEYKKKSKKKDKARRNEQFSGKLSARHIRITLNQLSNEEKNKNTKRTTRP